MAQKGMYAENYVASDKVHGLKCRRIGEKYLLKGCVSPSMKTQEPVKKPWIVCDCAGVVEAAHCSCMVGLAEACSHIAAILFTVMHLRHQTVIMSVTDRPAYWKLPGKRKFPDMTELSNIDFSTPEKILHRRKCGNEGQEKRKKTCKVPVPDDKEFFEALEELKGAGVFAPIHAIQEPFASDMLKEKSKLPKSLRSLFKEEHLSHNLQELQDAAAKLDISVSHEQVVAIEEATRLQSRSRKWFSLTAGKVRASLLYKCTHTELEDPAYSTVLQCCDPYRRRFSSRATRYGCKHEKDALADYTKKMKSDHSDFIIASCGTFTHTDYPEFTATPDSVIYCSCCGEGCVEVKCPLCRKDFDIADVQKDLEKNDARQYLIQTLCEENGDFLYDLKENHPYYYQVQAQMYLSGRDYCDFVMWTGHCFIQIRVRPNGALWEEVSEKGRLFFNKVLLPQLLGKFWTRRHHEQSKNKDPNNAVKGVKKLPKKKRKKAQTENNTPSNAAIKTGTPTPPSSSSVVQVVPRMPLRIIQIPAPTTPVKMLPPPTAAVKVLQSPTTPVRTVKIVLPPATAVKALQSPTTPLRTVKMLPPPTTAVKVLQSPTTPVRTVKIMPPPATAGKALQSPTTPVRPVKMLAATTPTVQVIQSPTPTAPATTVDLLAPAPTAHVIKSPAGAQVTPRLPPTSVPRNALYRRLLIESP